MLVLALYTHDHYSLDGSYELLTDSKMLSIDFLTHDSLVEAFEDSMIEEFKLCRVRRMRAAVNPRLVGYLTEFDVHHYDA